MNPEQGSTLERFIFSGRLAADEGVNERAPDASSDAPEANKIYRARFACAGRARASGNRPSNVILEAATLHEAQMAGLFDGLAVFIDHPAPFESSRLRNIAGRTRHSAWNAAEQAVDGEIRLYETESSNQLGKILDAVLAEGSPDIGLSMVFYPTWEKDSSGDLHIKHLRHIESVDFVFEPATNSRLLAALSSYHLNGGTMIELQHNPQDNQAQQAGSEAGSSPLAQASAQAAIAASSLPQASKERLMYQAFASPQAVQTAIEGERAYLARLSEEHVVQIGGQPPRGGHISMGRDGLERLSLALEALVAGKAPPSGVRPLSGLREFYHLITGDYEMNGVFQGERLSFANVNSATMSSMVANALNKVLANEFQQYPMWWSPIVLEQDFSNLQQVKWITLGGVGELPTVAEGAAYTELTWDDKYEAGTFIKKGGYLGLTLEAIDKDDTGRLRAAPRALAQAAWLTLSKTISAIFTANAGVGPTMSDSLALFHSSHANLGTTALSLASWNAVRLAMRKQTELNSGERLGGLTSPKYLLVPPDLEVTALQVLASESDYSYTLSSGQAAPVNPNAEGSGFDARMASAQRRVIVVDLWTDTDNWAAAADPRLYPTIGIGYRYGRTPEVFSVASPTAGLMFSNDTLPVKVRYIFAAGPIDYRGLYKQNV